MSSHRARLLPGSAVATADQSRMCLRNLFMLLLFGMSAGAFGATLTEHMDIACTQQDTALLRCDYRLLDGGNLESAVAEYDGAIATAEHIGHFPQADETTALMILVDTSDPARQPVIVQTIAQINALLERVRPHHRLGLASFDTELYVLAALGTPVADMRKAAANLEAKGKTTELYRNVREAVRLIGQSPDARKILLLMSDGLAEDFAYHHQDVIAEAREHGVSIYSIGYPRSVARSVALQTVRRLSDESGGLYFQANHVDYSIPDGIFDRILDSADSGGTLEIDLTPVLDHGVTGAIDLSLAFQTSTQSFLVLAPVLFPGETVTPPVPQAGAPAATLTTPLPPQPRPASPRRSATTQVDDSSLWPWLVGLTLTLVFILIALFFVLQRLRRVQTGTAEGSDVKPLAWVELNDASGTRYAIDKTPWRIGRGRNNDLVLPDHSVSRLHAEIRSNDEGQLLLNDLESLNGVFVNDSRSDSIQLREGDTVDVGDVRMKFTFQDESYENQEATVLVRTHTPT